MTAPRSVIIDGVVYVPAVDAVPTMKAILTGVCASFHSAPVEG
jgi:hypothetical protein